MFNIYTLRLAENPKVSVGVIEAGQHLADDVLINTPGSLHIITSGNTDV